MGCFESTDAIPSLVGEALEKFGAVVAEESEGESSSSNDLFRRMIKRSHNKVELSFESVGVLSGPLGVSSKCHDSLEADLFLIRNLDDQRDQSGQHDVLIRRDHTTHSAHTEQRGLELLPLRDTLSDANNLTTVLQYITHLMAEFAESFLLFAITIEEVIIIAALRLGELEVPNHDVDQVEVDIDELHASLHVAFQSDVLLEFQRIQTSDENDPSFTSLCEDACKTLEHFKVFCLGSLCNLGSDGHDSGVDGLDDGHAFVNVSCLSEDGAKSLDTGLKGYLTMSFSGTSLIHDVMHSMSCGFFEAASDDCAYWLSSVST
ncbi:ARM repeat-containing protein, partial [Aureobasidium melanogenum]